METTVTLAELARATEDLPLETPAAPTSSGASLATRTPSEEHLPPAPCHLPPSAEPSEADIATLTAQYHKALDGLYEAYKFGQMLLAVKQRLEDSLGSVTRDTAEISQGDKAIVGGWNAGTGLKAWLAQHCPEINYSTARRFLAVAEKTNAALALQAEAGDGDDQTSNPPNLQTSAPAPAPSEAQVRAFLEGKSQRQVLKAPKAEPAVRHAPTPEERAERIRETFAGFLTSLEGMVRTEETNVLRPDDRRELVTRLKSLARTLEAMAE